MNENWAFYFCSFAGRRASVFLDLSLEHLAPLAGLPYLGRVVIYMKHSQADGLSSSAESDTLFAMEDALKLALVHGRFVGRITTDGLRDLFFYLPAPEGFDATVNAVMGGFPAYEFEPVLRKESSWQSYLDVLIPNAEERQSIENRKVCEVLESHGDSLDEPREIDHWLYFSQPSQRELFAERVTPLGFEVRGFVEGRTDPFLYGIQLCRIDVPSLAAIDAVTLPLFRLAREFEGEYEGWGTKVR